MNVSTEANLLSPCVRFVDSPGAGARKGHDPQRVCEKLTGQNDDRACVVAWKGIDPERVSGSLLAALCCVPGAWSTPISTRSFIPNNPGTDLLAGVRKSMVVTGIILTLKLVSDPWTKW